MNKMDMTVKDLKEILKDLDDDMRVILPATDPYDCNTIENGFKHIRTAGVLSNRYEDGPALCLNAAADGIDISTQVERYKSDTTCDRVLF